MDYFGTSTASGVVVNDNLALNLSSVWACVQVLSQTIGSLPIITYRRSDSGKDRAVEHRLYNLLRYRPNPDMTSYSWKSVLMTNLGFGGNHYSLIERDGVGYPVALWPVDPTRIRPMRAKNGAIVYEYQPAQGEKKFYAAYDVFHVKGLSFNGLVGLSQLSSLRDVYGSAAAQQTAASKSFANGGLVTGVLETDVKTNDAAYDRLVKAWEAGGDGADKAYKTRILPFGYKFKATSINPQDQQLLESRVFSVEEIARIYRMPLHKIQSMKQSTNNNIEQQALEFVTDTVRPWAVNVEEEIQAKLVMPSEQGSIYCEFLIDALLRGDIKSRYEAYQLAVTNGIMTRNEVRERENLNQDPAGNKFYMPVNIAEIGAPKAEVKP